MIEQDLNKCEKDVEKILTAMKEKITELETHLTEECKIKPLPDDVLIVLDIAKSGYGIVEDALMLMFKRLSLQKLERIH